MYAITRTYVVQLCLFRFVEDFDIDGIDTLSPSRRRRPELCNPNSFSIISSAILVEIAVKLTLIRGDEVCCLIRFKCRLLPHRRK